MRKLLLLACVFTGMLCVTRVDAGVIPTIHVVAGSHDLYADTLTEIQFTVTGDAQVQGLFLAVQIGDQMGLTGTAPRIDSVDIISPGLLFGSNNTLDSGMGSGAPDSDAYWEANTTTNSGFVSPPAGGVVGLLARVVIDTTGWKVGDVFQIFLLSDEQQVSSTFAFPPTAGVDQSFENGRIRIIENVPEPSSLLLMLAGVSGLGVVAFIRRKRSA